ncbi:hypothetical protein B0H65DRAFT_541901 [Neurospora tetraspora]|uniref:Uncharacterized protein n=1 Tax=Neurospora tetraspora TaxID=94610 RepID=A0AAE0MNV7_9PEZI|nr:hypothetical protein B0H65DRAFT_541901 [Neurospora tetraspora]
MKSGSSKSCINAVAVAITIIITLIIANPIIAWYFPLGVFVLNDPLPLKACPDFALQYRYRGRTSGGGAALRAPSPSVLTTVAAAEMSQNSSENEEEDEKEDKRSVTLADHTVTLSASHVEAAGVNRELQLRFSVKSNKRRSRVAR